ncbi:hypothetical protein C2E23DRAFT_850130 [Lenzites betulinus]|nr:hypothetical protein C2E23DRAFT_850130 [Lenzites betulinus]
MNQVPSTTSPTRMAVGINMTEPEGRGRSDVSSLPPPPSQTVDIDTNLLKDISGELKLQELLDQQRGVHTDDARTKAWSDVATKAQTFGDDLVNRWNREIDIYLLFAGLFSAILTAFNVESYRLLQSRSSDPTVQALERISLQLHSFSISYPFVNSTQPGSPAVRDTADGLSSVAQSAIWLNILWFSGLILSLTSALIGIVAKQWLSEYSAVSGNSRDKARLRQYLAKNLVKWRVGDIVLFIPILLVISLAFFLAGLLVLLWTLHHSVAIVASILVAIVAVFTSGVAILPALSVSCAYLSPQSRALYSIWQLIHKRVLIPIQHYLLSVPAKAIYETFDVSDRIGTFLLWLKVEFDNYDAKRSTVFSWNDRIKSSIDRNGDTLDVDILVTAYESTLDPDAVSSATICLSDLRSNGVLEYFTKLHESIVKHSRRDHKAPVTGSYPTSALLVFHVLLCAIDLSTMKIQEDLCRQVCLDLTSPRHHIAKDGDCSKEESARWLQSVVTWLEPRVEHYLTPILEYRRNAETELNENKEAVTSKLKVISSHCQILSQSTSRYKGTETDPVNDSTISIDRAFDLLCRQLVRCQPFVLEQLDVAGGSTRTEAGVTKAQLKYLSTVLTFLRLIPTALTFSDRKKRTTSYTDASSEVLSQLFTVLDRYRDSLEAACLEDLIRTGSETNDYLTSVLDIANALQDHAILPLVKMDMITTFDCLVTFFWNLPSAENTWGFTLGMSLGRLQEAQISVNKLQSRFDNYQALRVRDESDNRRSDDGVGKRSTLDFFTFSSIWKATQRDAGSAIQPDPKNVPVPATAPASVEVEMESGYE